MQSVVGIIICFTALLVRAADRPNIIWIVGEDLGPELRCYGDSYSHTPNIDKLAREYATRVKPLPENQKP